MSDIQRIFMKLSNSMEDDKVNYSLQLLNVLNNEDRFVMLLKNLF